MSFEFQALEPNFLWICLQRQDPSVFPTFDIAQHPVGLPVRRVHRVHRVQVSMQRCPLWMNSMDPCAGTRLVSLGLSWSGRFTFHSEKGTERRDLPRIVAQAQTCRTYAKTVTIVSKHKTVCKSVTVSRKHSQAVFFFLESGIKRNRIHRRRLDRSDV